MNNLLNLILDVKDKISLLHKLNSLLHHLSQVQYLSKFHQILNIQCVKYILISEILAQNIYVCKYY